MSRILGAIVEVRLDHGKKSNKPDCRGALRKALKQIHDMDGKMTIAGYLVGGVLTDALWKEIDEPCIVPDFGHDIECKCKCKCKHKEEYGVLRLFGLEIAIEGYPEPNDVFGTYKLSEDVQLRISISSNSDRVDNPKAVEKIKGWNT